MAPIHGAAARGDLEEMMRLIQKDPQVVHSTNRYEQTALFCASANGHVEVVCYLLDQGADINARDHNGITTVVASGGSLTQSINQS